VARPIGASRRSGVDVPRPIGAIRRSAACMAEIGILGGTFNPPHMGHLVMLEEARDQLGLDRLLLMPVARPPHKEAHDDPGGDVRLELCRLAVADAPDVEVSALEVDRGGASYTVDTLRALHDRDPEHALTFIVGGDMAHSLPSWREPEAVLQLARLAVAERDGLRREDIADRLSPLHDGDRVVFFDMPRIDLSSSAIRERVAGGRSIRYLVPEPVAAAIRSRNLYRSKVGRPAA
jgi:nicotinate-nucleotide adenylyltransferase